MVTRMVASLLLLSACSTPGPVSQPGPELGWLAGCWAAEDGRTFERWHATPDGYLFGHNVVMGDGKVQFFEQLRIEPGDQGPVFNAYPRGLGPTTFQGTITGPQSVTFVNPAHDYPQRIAYELKGDFLVATIGLADGSRPGQWRFRRCTP